jgi:purine-binding chemotaxis protein CheW
MVDNETTVLGALADSVQEVVDLEPGQIEPAPQIGTRLNTEFIKGMGKQNNRFIIILDINRVFSADELALVQGDRAAPAGEQGP